MTATARSVEELESHAAAEPADPHADGGGRTKLEETLGHELAGRLVTALSSRGAADRPSRG